MKNLYFAACCLVSIFSTCAIAQEHSVLEKSTPLHLNPGSVVTSSHQESVLEAPTIAPPSDFGYQPPTPQPTAPSSIPAVIVERPSYIPQGIQSCVDCRKAICCCKSQAFVEAEFCIVDPLGCSHEICARVPSCCANEIPTVQWSKRILGRKVATLCWACCDHEIRVIVTRRGKVKVRD